MSTRAEHVAWCKERALEYVDAGDAVNAVASLVSDLGKHPETAGDGSIILTGMLMVAGELQTPEQVRAHIEGVR